MVTGTCCAHCELCRRKVDLRGMSQVQFSSSLQLIGRTDPHVYPREKDCGGPCGRHSINTAVNYSCTEDTPQKMLTHTDIFIAKRVVFQALTCLILQWKQFSEIVD